MEILLIATIIVLLVLLYYKASYETFSNIITVTKNGPNISIFFENEKKNKTCQIKIFEAKNKKLLKDVELDLDPSDKFGRYDLNLMDLKSHIGKKLETKIKIGDKEYSQKFKLNLDDVSKTEKIMCHADGSITYGNCDAEDIMPEIGDFFSNEEKQKRKLLMRKLKKRKHYKIII